MVEGGVREPREGDGNEGSEGRGECECRALCNSRCDSRYFTAPHRRRVRTWTLGSPGLRLSLRPSFATSNDGREGQMAID